MTMVRGVRWGIAGTGRIAAQFAADLRLAPGATLEAVAGRDRARAEAFARSAGAARSCGGYEALIADPDIDIVYIATETALHAPLALLAIDAGKPSLIEKPLAATAAEAAEIAARARARGVFCMEAIWMRFTPAVAALRALVASGRLGPLRRLEAGLGFAAAYDPSDWRFDPARGGGALRDLGVYPVSLAIHLFGPPRTVTGETRRGPNGVDIATAAVLGYPDRLALIGCGYDAEGANEAVLTGETGRARLAAPFINAPRLTLTRTRGPSPATPASAAIPGASRLRALKALLLPFDPRALRPRLTLSRGGGLQFEAREAMRCMTAGLCESPLAPLSESVETLRVLDALSRIEEVSP